MDNLVPQTTNAATARGANRLYTWAAYAACAWGLIFAGISFYWGLGGRAGISTVGGAIERRALAGDPVIFAAVWITGVLKVFGAALALALVQPWGRRLPRRPVTVLAWIAAVGLTLYGGLLEVTNTLVATHVVKPSQPVEWKALLWHLWVWDMSFFVWGILFAVALRGYRRRSRTAKDPSV